MTEHIYCFLCKVSLVTEEEKKYGAHYNCAVDFAKSNITNLSYPEQVSIIDPFGFENFTDLHYGTHHKSTLVAFLFNLFIVCLFLFAILVNGSMF